MGQAETCRSRSLLALARVRRRAARAAARRRRASAAELAATRVDALTGLPNGAQLRDDISAFVAGRLGDECRTLLIFDLVGFKKYNDSFGFACGDALLRRLSRKLTDAVGEPGPRLPPARRPVRRRRDAVEPPRCRCGRPRDALFEIGEGFMIRCAQGRRSLPQTPPTSPRPSSSPTRRSRPSARRCAARASTTSRSPPPSAPPRVAPSRLRRRPSSSVAVGQCLGLGGEELDHLECAAALRDVGMMSVPDAVVHAPGRLTDEDWQLRPAAHARRRAPAALELRHGRRGRRRALQPRALGRRRLPRRR